MFHAKTTGAFISAAADDPPFPPDPAQIHLILPNALLLSFYPTMKLTAAAILSLAGFASAETFFTEQFDDVSVSPRSISFGQQLPIKLSVIFRFGWFESRGSTSAIIWLQCRGPTTSPRSTDSPEEQNWLLPGGQSLV